MVKLAKMAGRRGNWRSEQILYQCTQIEQRLPFPNGEDADGLLVVDQVGKLLPQASQNAALGGVYGADG